MTLKQQVLEILKTDEKSRNSDDRLYQMILYVYNRHLLFQNQNGDWAITLKNIPEAPNKSDLQRYRAYWQNSRGMFLPTAQQVLKLRRIKESNLHNEFSPSNPSRG